jgi:hypothetical protein
VPTPDRLRPAPYIAGLAGAAAIALTGVWLIVAPFAVGYQPDGADWVDATVIGIATGAALIVLGLVTLVVLATAIRAEAHRRGLLPTSDVDVDAGRTDRPDEAPSDHDDELAAGPADLESVLAPLAAALLEDLRNGHETHELDRLGENVAQIPDHPSA